MDGKIPLRSGKPFMLRQALHERLAGRFLRFREVIFNGILRDKFSVRPSTVLWRALSKDEWKSSSMERLAAGDPVSGSYSLPRE
ncbi:MAG: hypothetical protein HOP23_03225 [Methylococcaceae bacterium]|nr:hypothetical protein [Methylococcaceae bacterium]